MTSTLKKPALKQDILGHLGFELVCSGRDGERAECPETSWNSGMDTKRFEQQSSQVLSLSANVHIMQKVEKYMQTASYFN